MGARVLLVEALQDRWSAAAQALRHEPFELAWARTVDDALRWVDGHPVDVVVGDERLCGAALSELASRLPGLRCVLTVGPVEDDAVREALGDSRVVRVLRRPYPLELLRRALHDAVARAGDGALTAAPPRAQVAATLPGLSPALLGKLTAREREVLEQLVLGRRVKEAAAALGMSQHTVRNHVKVLFRKLSVHSQESLVALAARPQVRSSAA